MVEKAEGLWGGRRLQHGVVAIGQFLGALPKIVATIRSVIGVNDDLIALLNEVASLQAILKLVDEAVNSTQPESLQQTSLPSADYSTVRSITSELEVVIKELQQLAQDCQRKKNDQILPKAKRSKWLWEKRRMQQLQGRVKGTRASLQLAFSAVSLSDQRSQASVLLEVHQIVLHQSSQIEHLHDSLIYDNRVRDLGEQEALSSSIDGAGAKEPSIQSLASDKTSTSWIVSQDQQSDCVQIHRYGQHPHLVSETDNDYITIDVAHRRYCDSSCHCQCHFQRSKRCSPSWMKSLLGSFFLSYNFLPILEPRKCNVATCFNTNNSIEFTWFLPFWAWQRGISIAVLTGSAFGRGAQVSLEIPAIIPYAHPIWTPWARRSVDWMAETLSADNIRPTDCEETGQSLLYWAVTFTDRLRFLAFLLKYYNITSAKQIQDRRVGFNARRLYLDNIALDKSARQSLHQLIELTDNGKFIESKIHQSLRGGGDLAHSILEERWAINRWDKFGDTPLTLACTMGNADGVARLIAAGADIDSLSSRELSPLNYACFDGFVDCVRILISAGCNVNAKHAYRPPVHDCLWSTAGPDTKEAILRLLSESGSDLNAVDRWTNSPLQMAIVRGESHVFRVLLDLGGKVNVFKLYNGWGLLHYLASYGNFETIRTLLGHDLSLLNHDPRENRNMTPVDIFKCAMHEHLGLSNPDWRRPAAEEVDVFEELIRRIRDPKIQRQINAAQSAIVNLRDNDEAAALNVLQSLIQWERNSGKLEEAETLRVIGLQIRNKTWEDAIESLKELTEVWIEILDTPPLHTKSWVDQHKGSAQEKSGSIEEQIKGKENKEQERERGAAAGAETKDG